MPCLFPRVASSLAALGTSDSASPPSSEESTAALRSLAAKIEALEGQLATVQAAAGANGTVLGGGGGGGAGLAAVEAKVGEYGKVLQAMRNRIVALQVGGSEGVFDVGGKYETYLCLLLHMYFMYSMYYTAAICSSPQHRAQYGPWQAVSLCTPP
jgi:hypothetical protein